MSRAKRLRELRSPQLESEIHVLGAALIPQYNARSMDEARSFAADVYDRCAAIIDPADFSEPWHGAIWAAIGRLTEAGQPVDPVTVTDAMRTAGDLTSDDEASYVYDLASAISTAVNIEHHAKVVAGYARNRRHAQIAADAAARARAASWNEADEALDATVDAFFAASERKDGGRLVSLKSAALSIVQEARRLHRDKTPKTVIGAPTGLQEFDRLTRGLRPGHLYCLGARPGIGKTAVALEMAQGVVEDGSRSALYASLEVPVADIAVRSLGAKSGVNTERIESGGLTDDDVDRLVVGVQRIANVGDALQILDMPGATLAAIRSAARRMKRTRGIPPLAAVFVDYLQLMRPPERIPNNREREVALISAGLLEIAKAENVAIVACAQLNRACEARADKRPILADLRESGSIEQDCSVVAFVYRDDFYNAESNERGIAEIILRKNRTGRVGTARVNFDKSCQRVADLETRYGNSF